MALLNRQFPYCAVVEKKTDDNGHFYADRDGTRLTPAMLQGKNGYVYPCGQFVDDYMERVTDAKSGKRYYATKTGNLSSVTTILDYTGDKSKIEMWRKRVGEEEAERVKREATGLGSLMHTHLEHHIMNIERPGGNNLVRKMAREMADVIIQNGLPHLEEVWGMEEGLYFPSLYAGTTDLIGVYRGKPAIIDYKSAKKLKKEEDIEDYFIQCSAYAAAHNELFGTDIGTVVILMADRSLKFREFFVSGAMFDRYFDKWLERFEKFHNATCG